MKKKRSFQIVVSVSTLSIEYSISANSTPAQRKELDEAIDARFRENGFEDDWYKESAKEELALSDTPIDWGEQLDWADFPEIEWSDFETFQDQYLS